MKIALSFPGCHPRGGVERLVLETANFLARKGHDVHVVASEFCPSMLDPAIVQHAIALPGNHAIFRLASFAQRSPAVLRRVDADISGTFGVICPSGGVFNVQSVHAAWLEVSQRIRNLKGRLRQALNPLHPMLLALERYHFAERRYLQLIVPTAQVKADLMRFYKVPETDIKIIPNGYCNETHNAARSEMLRPFMREQLGFAETDFVIVFIGNELERKGFEPLLRAITRLKNSRIHLLAVVGRVDITHYQIRAQRLGIINQVHFIGPQDDVVPYYACADVLALPTQYEAWGLVIVEALACGTPVLTSRLAGAATTVCEGTSGELLENPLDIEEISAKLELLAKRSGSISRESISFTVQHLAWKSVLEKYEILLKSLFKRIYC